jgi:hypothetical protein
MKSAPIFLQRNDVDTPINSIPLQAESVLPCAWAYDDPAQKKEKKTKTNWGKKKKKSGGKFFGLWILLPGEMGLKPHLIAKTWSDSSPHLLTFFFHHKPPTYIFTYFTLSFV